MRVMEVVILTTWLSLLVRVRPIRMTQAQCDQSQVASAFLVLVLVLLAALRPHARSYAGYGICRASGTPLSPAPLSNNALVFDLTFEGEGAQEREGAPQPSTRRSRD
jgi:hypothetical protein